MCGIAGSGKSTWARAQPDNYVVSRDDIRLMLLEENEEYFAKENEVFDTFVKYIQEALDSDETPTNVYADATHITTASRNKLLHRLNLDNVNNITVVVLRPSLKETLRRNKQRSGRRYVPENVIRDMWFHFQRPEEDKDRIFDTMYVEVPE